MRTLIIYSSGPNVRVEAIANTDAITNGLTPMAPMRTMQYHRWREQRHLANSNDRGAMRSPTHQAQCRDNFDIHRDRIEP